ncbi:unnamed protein product [Owenia fusiformis]|uniref:Uncharacterized protein n=1 Tax=Owenia fusiformis TaxID=6347 RepID=A0A8J1Y9S1_OWEFU|nr:unnamed protein product [Owenia fusiformis]
MSTDSTLVEFISHQTHYEQFGEMKGSLQIDGGTEMMIALRGVRDHSYGVRNWHSIYRYIIHMGHLEDGRSFHIGVISMPGALSYLKMGFLMQANSRQFPITWTDLDLANNGENQDAPGDYAFSFKAGGKLYTLQVNVRYTHIYYQHEDWRSVVHERIANFTMNGVKGYGISELLYRNEGMCPITERPHTVTMLKEPSVGLEKNTLVFPFTHNACGSSLLVGGKGSQLALLSTVGEQMGFTVPKGFCVTIAAFDQHLQNNCAIEEKIRELSDITSGQRNGDFQCTCEALVRMFQKSPLQADVKIAIEEMLQHVFADTWREKAFAVRSSAAGEDSEEMSAAGQMETLLGVRGLENIYTAVLKCWASHFTFQAVEYRRQHGQAIKSTMGVPIQEMVHAETAGVLFTRDPVTGNPGVMTMNANYGLGESVVSGLSDPDTIVISKTWDDKLSILDKQLGSKKVSMNVTESGGTETVDVKEDAVHKCSVADDVIIRLANIGIELEKAFGDPRDIEWAVSNNKIYLLQARPITTLQLESTKELMHEFDSALSFDTESVTTANIGEMMPGAMTPLTISTFFRAVENTMQEFLLEAGCIDHKCDLYKAVALACNNAFINLHNLYGTSELYVLGSDKRMVDLALLGYVNTSVTIEQLRSIHGECSLPLKLWHKIMSTYSQNRSYGRTKEWERRIRSQEFTVGQNCDTAISVYNDIDSKMMDYYDMWVDTILNTSRSGVWSVALIATISGGGADWTSEHYSDVALLLADCTNVYSADVPSALQELVDVIFKTGQADHFTKLTPEEAANWLKSSESGDAGERFTQFLNMHGHRCIREAEFREKSWRSEPWKVTAVLQNIVRGPRNNKAAKVETSIEDAISQLKTPISKNARMVLKFIVPRARRAVGDREWGKSVSIEMVDIFKKAYWKLAKLMVTEGRLPDEDLLFFFTHQELKVLLESRSGRLVAKAAKRRRILPQQMSLHFSHLNMGHPIPVEETVSEEDYKTLTEIKGMPVSQGEVKGTARVVTSLQEANEIQQGDILIVHFTDVGWTPYFPLIAGLVTEIGGLVSHGAVVAREYGLPCIVSAPKATKLIKSGDEVILNGTLGTIKRVLKTN